jgi:hypothetical protein
VNFMKHKFWNLCDRPMVRYVVYQALKYDHSKHKCIILIMYRENHFILFLLQKHVYVVARLAISFFEQEAGPML